MNTSTLPRHPRLRKPSTMCALMTTRQRTLEQLYLRRATLENLIRSLEMYDHTVKLVASKVTALP